MVYVASYNVKLVCGFIYVVSYLQKYPRTDRLLDNESASLGVFKPDVADPELSCADSAVLWELPLLTVSYFV